MDPVITIRPVAAPIGNDGTSTQQNPLTAVANGTLVEGFVINRDAQNNPVLRTSLGDLQVTSDVFLKTGSEVVFRVDANVPSLARILSVDGLSPEAYNAQNVAQTITEDTVTSTLPNLASSPAQAAASTLPARANAPLLEAILLQLQPQAANLTPNAPTGTKPASSPLYSQLALLRAGSAVPLTLLDLKLPPLPVALQNIPTSNKLDGLLSEAPAMDSHAPEIQRAASEIASPMRNAAFIPTQPNQTVAEELAHLTSTKTNLPAVGQSLPTPTTTPQKPFGEAEVFIPTSTQSFTSSTQAGTPKPVLPGGAAGAVMIANEIASTTEETGPKMTIASPLTEAKAARVMENMVQQLTGQTPAATPPAGARTAYSSYAATNPVYTAISAAAQAPHAPNMVEAQVIGHDADGGNILHTQLASFKLYTTQPLPTGTTLTIALDPANAKHEHASAVGLALTQTAAQDRAGVDMETSFKPLQQALNWLLSNQPDAARDLVQHLPSPTAKLTNDMLLYLAAIKGGNLEDVLGKRTLRLLETATPALVKSAREELATLGAALAETRPAQWMNLPIPLLLGQQVEMLKLYIHPDAFKNPSRAGGGDGQRFILEAHLSELGPMQFDGFVRKTERRRSFDLVVRSLKPLDAALSQSIRDIFTSSMEAVRMHGQVVFQVGNQHFFHPSKTSSGDSGNETILA